MVDRQTPVNGAVETFPVAGAGAQQARRVTAKTRGTGRRRRVGRVEVLRTLRVTERQQKELRLVARVYRSQHNTHRFSLPYAVNCLYPGQLVQCEGDWAFRPSSLYAVLMKTATAVYSVVTARSELCKVLFLAVCDFSVRV